MTSVKTDIGFSDGEITKLLRVDDRLEVSVSAWNEERLTVLFTGVLGSRESMIGEISDLVVSESKGELWEWCLQRAYDPPTAGVTEKLYQFLDNDGQTALEVVAASVEVLRMGPAKL